MPNFSGNHIPATQFEKRILVLLNIFCPDDSVEKTHEGRQAVNQAPAVCGFADLAIGIC